jgi:hypothetical protein
MQFYRSVLVKLSRASTGIKHLAVTAYLSLAGVQMAQAQTMSTAVTGFQQMVQWGANITSAVAGLTGIIWGFSALRTMVNASKDGGRGESKGHSAVWHALGAAGCFCLCGILYMVANQVFGSGSQAPTLYTPNLTPTQN